MYSVAVLRELRAFHYLIGGDWGPENELHPHSYRVEVILEGGRLDGHGYLVDITQLEEGLQECVVYYHDRTLNDLPEFRGLNPSIEHLARFICRRIVEGLDGENLKGIQVRIWESETAWAGYAEPLG